SPGRPKPDRENQLPRPRGGPAMRPCRSPSVWVAAALVALTAAAASPPAPAQGGAPGAYPLTLGECIRLALEQRPRGRAARDMLAQRQNTFAELDRMARHRGFLRPDLLVRREQSALSIELTRAALEGQEAEARHVVARLYLSVLHARAVRRLADRTARRAAEAQELLGKLKDLPNGAQLLGAAREGPGLPKRHPEPRVTDADRGEAGALAALAEAIGLDACHPLDVPDVPLPPAPAGVPDRAELLRLIEARNPDLRRARLTEQITRLEADAQKQT